MIQNAGSETHREGEIAYLARVEQHLSQGTSGALRQLGYWIGTGTLGYPLLEGIDWVPLAHDEPSLLEQALAIWANTLLLDDDGNPTNAKDSEKRAAQYIRQYCTGEAAEPPFEDWEVHLY